MKLKGNYFMSEEVVEEDIPQEIVNIARKGIQETAKNFKSDYTGLLSKLKDKEKTLNDLIKILKFRF